MEDRAHLETEAGRSVAPPAAGQLDGPDREFYRLILEHGSEAIALVTPEGRISYMNAALEELVGYTQQELSEQGPWSILHPEDLQPARQRAEHLLSNSGGTLRFTGRLQHRNGSWRSVEVTCKNLVEEPRLQAVLCNIRDVTQSVKRERQLAYEAMHDPLTGLPNRRLLMDRIEQALAYARRGNTKIALLYLDVDGFKTINDTAGHAVGDLLLIEIAQRISNSVRRSDTVARIGGDEFILIAPYASSPEAIEHLAMRILSALGEPFIIRGKAVSTSVSIGISMFPSDGLTASDLVQKCDAAMYAAKANGKNRYARFAAGEIAVARTSGTEGNYKETGTGYHRNET